MAALDEVAALGKVGEVAALGELDELVAATATAAVGGTCVVTGRESALTERHLGHQGWLRPASWSRPFLVYGETGVQPRCASSGRPARTLAPTDDSRGEDRTAFVPRSRSALHAK